MYQAGCHVRWHRVFADAGYDAEHNHEFCRDVLGMKSSIIALNRRNMGRRWPLTKYRRQMKRTAYRRDYGQRWQVESVFSRYKRLFGAALRARTDASQAREMLLRVLVHNLMLLRRVACFQQSKSVLKSDGSAANEIEMIDNREHRQPVLFARTKLGLVLCLT